MKKALSIVLVLAMLLSVAACGGGNTPPSGSVVSGTGTVEFQSSSDQPPLPPPESPDAVTGESSAATLSSSASQSISSLPPASSSQPESQAPPQQETETPAVSPGGRPPADEVRSVWVSYLELGSLLTNKSSSAYRANIAQVMDNCADFGLNTVVLQVRPFADAIYPSAYFPQSYLFNGTEGNLGEAPFDALQIAIEEARKRGLRIEAWLNPYRVRNKADRGLSDDNAARTLMDSGDAVKMGEVITYNPASEKAQELIVNGVIELVENYDIDAIHFDDYFYPTTDAAFDATQYNDYKADGGTKNLASWRRGNVTTLVRKVYDAIKSRKPAVQLGISPQGNMQNNLNAQFVDVEEIIKLGIIDYICPQMYFGFQNSGCPYQQTIEDFNRMTKGTNVAVYVGLATYKFNKVDTWAGNGKNEWIGTTDIIKRQVEAARGLSQYGGFVLYRYDSSFALDSFYGSDSTAKSQAKTEMGNLKKLL